MSCSLLREFASCFMPRRPSAPKPAPTNPVTSDRVRVAIIGGGAAGVAAAFRLSDPGLGGHYDITLYQTGWRLGGKCASGREAPSQRIKEHGLHMLLGCYQYVFYAMRHCFQEWVRPRTSPWNDWTDLFTQQHDITMVERDVQGRPQQWERWKVQFDLLGRSEPPGEDSGSGDHLPAVLGICELLNPFTRTLRDFMQKNLPQDLTIPDEAQKFVAATTAVSNVAVVVINTGFDTLLAQLSGHSVTLEPALATLNNIDQLLRSAYARQRVDGVWCPLEGELSQAERRAFIMLNLGVAILGGAISDVCLKSGSEDSLNDVDFRDWLRKHGACEISVRGAPIRVLYDLMFAYVDGNAGASSDDPARITNGSVAAGAALRFVMEAVTGFKQSPVWKMNAGMGDTIFTPMYEVLEARRVDVKFFHRAKRIGLTADHKRIGEIELEQQVELNGLEYRPLIRVATSKGDLDCWPDHPRWEQIKHGAQLAAAKVDLESAADTTSVRRVKVELGTHFDVVIVALPPEVLKTVASELPQHSPAWKTALDASRSVVTKAVQLWMSFSAENLGGESGAVVSGFEPAFTSFAEMSHLLPVETWPGVGPRSLVYACGCVRLQETIAPGGPDDPQTFVTQQLPKLWANLGAPTLAPTIVGEYARTNSDPSELYVQTPPRTVSTRLSPDQPYFDNLFVCGDWVRTRFSGGCVESAFESGFRAADAVRANFIVDTAAQERIA
ncbi:MAG TPA: FAD-dependent oxidoreductase [Burkholderiales bacterium]|nr:FAD-dependent oxidoreductase [Burkholderiales bacterium]